jgi:hypothetical protein
MLEGLVPALVNPLGTLSTPGAFLAPEWYVGDSVYVSGSYSSVMGITRFQLHQFSVSFKELAEWFGLEVGATRGGRMPGLARELNAQSMSNAHGPSVTVFRRDGKEPDDSLDSPNDPDLLSKTPASSILQRSDRDKLTRLPIIGRALAQSPVRYASG